ncbi:tRNA uridine-5-carboxymethylaminomethyl(34) synthesis GTPase MnmE [Zavarzinella formosa]|uniref:tRNA uridine-5-carboxymethylaminomethyl(34) synthesis GTPase MnmE n=1 Tax=Zavarzinella formosa TaxID=360055 RepID=UPI000300F970|nr:tRNA uridine-5-carboxymethylaminomethyl(34) synthesis GTPase MnmE [Zavarzinella formosa]
MHPEDTIVALASAPGSGMRAVIRLSGSQSFRIVTGISDAVISERGIVSVELKLPGVHSSLPADVYVMPGPRSYTGQDCAEIHTISSPPLVDLLIATLMNAGARAAQPGEFTMRAFLAGKKDLTQAEAVLAVIHAGSEDELKTALTQLAGGMTQPLQALREDLLNLLADVEAGLDFTDEHIEFVDQKEILLRLGKGMAHLTNLKKQLETRSVSDRPFRVAFVGEPNAGKSSLFNALAGSADAIVSPVAGTTRDYLTRTVTLKGLNIELIDTAGWQEAGNVIEEQAQKLGKEQTRHADLVIWCVEAATWVQSREQVNIPAGLTLSHPPTLVLTKVDLIEETVDHLATSAKTAQGLEKLRSHLAEQAREARPPALASSLSRCKHHVEKSLGHMRAAHHIVLFEEPAELLALELRLALDQIGEMVGAIYTDDLLDRIFSRFCIGK